MDLEYQTYKEQLPEYMAGYTGHIPTVQKEEYINHIVHTKHIPGYMGFVSAIKSENKYGESYGKETAQSLAGTIRKGTDVPSYVRYTSTAREDYKEQDHNGVLDQCSNITDLKVSNAYLCAAEKIDNNNKYINK